MRFTFLFFTLFFLNSISIDAVGFDWQYRNFCFGSSSVSQPYADFNNRRTIAYLQKRVDAAENKLKSLDQSIDAVDNNCKIGNKILIGVIVVGALAAVIYALMSDNSQADDTEEQN